MHLTHYLNHLHRLRGAALTRNQIFFLQSMEIRLLFGLSIHIGRGSRLRYNCLSN